jgi:hypothetical protein
MSDNKIPAQKKTKDEPGARVDEQVEDSFPASDPPSYNAGGRVGRPDHAKDEKKKKEKDGQPGKADK